MKPALVQNQHLAVKIAIFITALVSTFEINLRQIALQSLLILVFMLFEPSLYKKLLFALKRLLFFLTAYWLFATLFNLDFLASLVFSSKIIFLVLLMVFVWASINKELVLWQLRYFLRCRLIRSFISFVLTTFYFMKEYLDAYSQIQATNEISGILQKAVYAGKQVHAKSESIQNKVSQELSQNTSVQVQDGWANLLGISFLLCMVILHAI